MSKQRHSILGCLQNSSRVWAIYTSPRRSHHSQFTGASMAIASAKYHYLLPVEKEDQEPRQNDAPSCQKKLTLSLQTELFQYLFSPKWTIFDSTNTYKKLEIL